MGRQRLSRKHSAKNIRKRTKIIVNVDGHAYVSVETDETVVKIKSGNKEPQKGWDEFLVRSASFVTWLQFLFSALPSLSRIGSQLLPTI